MKATLSDLKLELWLRRRNNGDIKWETKTGDTIPIKNISDSHLRNIINMIERNIVNKQEQEDYEHFMKTEILGSMDPMDYYD